jgi:hypothetical protein
VDINLDATLKAAISQTIELYNAVSILRRANVRIQQSYNP